VTARRRIAVDATSFSPVGKGLARVQRETVRALAELDRYDVVAYVSADVDLGVPVIRRRRRPALLLEQVDLYRAARHADAVLTWTDRLPIASGGRFVVWLFELPTHRIAANRAAGAGVYQRSSDLLTSALWRRSLLRAAAVVAGSGVTAAEIRRELPDLAEVHVLYPGLAAEFTPGRGRSGRYVFHLGSSDPRDNTAAVVAAVARANARLREPVRLLVAGGSAVRRSDGAEYLGRVTDDELLELYRGAAVYADASLYEGFGYQPLEAMACGTPVVASDTPAAREVVDSAALLCDARDIDGRAAAIVRVLQEPELADELRQRGLRRAAAFSWERTARMLAEVLDEATR